MAVIKSIFIEKFRKLENVEIPIGKKLTIISGQNGTMKSTILGMLGQPFGWDANKTIHGRSFKAKFGESFKWSPKFDVPKTHKYCINFLSIDTFGKESEVISSYDRIGSVPPIRLVTGDKRGAGDGNIDFPVLYLSLKRVFPIGSLTRINETESSLSPKEKADFILDYNDLMLNCSPVVVSNILTESSTKQTIAASSLEHDGLTISAGQDNLGQILGAIISFGRLKMELAGNYKGGLLLIDEVDATLHPSVRDRLIRYLCKKSRDLDLQVVFTTHSLEIIKLIQTKYSGNNDDCIILYFKREPSQAISFSVNKKYEEIVADMTAETIPDPPKPIKIDVFCEDDEAMKFTKQLLKGKFLQYSNILSVELGCQELKGIASSKAYVFKQTVFCLDGDTTFNAKELNVAKKPKNPNLVIIPGGLSKSSPELLFCNFLESLPENDSFFCTSTNGYTKRVFLNHRPLGEYDRVKYKNWFQKECKLWDNRNGFGRLFKRWAVENNESINIFIEDFRKAYNCAALEKGTPLINIWPI